MNSEIIALIAIQVAVLGFLWALHRDISSLRERMAKMEGQIEGIRTSVEAFEGQINTLRGLVISRAGGHERGNDP